ncbi:MAG: hypothetical protein BWX66_00968 [Deltaproteobacteria bacterium ADurb.Bin058]|nr:MAG: hypothetical protein BWX66_00968 [Deltaproteobacteria bacterium ADurb.Bin058]
MAKASHIGVHATSRTLASSASSTTISGMMRLGFPTSLAIVRCSSIKGWAAFSAKTRASTKTCSETNWASPSTIVSPSGPIAHTMSRSAPLRSVLVGLTKKRPSLRAILSPTIGPRNGMSENINAADAPIIAGMAGSFSWSADKTMATT